MRRQQPNRETISRETPRQGRAQPGPTPASNARHSSFTVSSKGDEVIEIDQAHPTRAARRTVPEMGTVMIEGSVIFLFSLGTFAPRLGGG